MFFWIGMCGYGNDWQVGCWIVVMDFLCGGDVVYFWYLYIYQDGGVVCLVFGDFCVGYYVIFGVIYVEIGGFQEGGGDFVVDCVVINQKDCCVVDGIGGGCYRIWGRVLWIGCGMVGQVF